MFKFFRKKNKDKNLEQDLEKNAVIAETESEELEENQETESSLDVEPQVTLDPPLQWELTETQAQAEVEQPVELKKTPATEPEKKVGFFQRLRNQLTKSRTQLTDGLASLVLGKKTIDADLLDDLEMLLISADLGLDTTDYIIGKLTDQVSRKELKDPEALTSALKEILYEILAEVEEPLVPDTTQQPFVILMVGINGAGKTTTIGKLAKKFTNEGKKVMLAAGDTFRAAAVEQLQTWGERNNVPVIAQGSGADSAAVIFDTLQAAKARDIDIVLADTAGRLHTQSNLMEELKKVHRVMQRFNENTPHEVMLILDASTGQNAMNQAKEFQKAVKVSGITLTKMDGTAKGGIIFSLAQELKIPVRFIGVGESVEDLQTFSARDFIDALFNEAS